MTYDSAAEWLRERSFHHSRYTEEILAAREERISVCLPTRECAQTIGAIVEVLVEMRDRGVVDQVVVVDADSRDGTAQIAARAGAEVHAETDLMTAYGPVIGKGDAMWRALSVLDGELICFLDADVVDFTPHYPVGMLGPLIEFDEVAFVKAFYRRPFRHGDLLVPDGGGRVNHLLARPALAIFEPLLAGVRQPLAGEIAARRSLLESLPFATGYGVEIAMLLDTLAAVGLDGMAQVDLDSHDQRHQSIEALSEMAHTVLHVLATRLERDGRLTELDASPLLLGEREFAAPLIERPPMVSAASQ